MEKPRLVRFSLAGHGRWLFEQHDHRFRLDESFPFVVCSCTQRRQSLASAKLQMRLGSFKRHAAELLRLTIEDLTLAAQEEEHGLPISNCRVRLFRQHVFETASHVFAADVVRYGW